MAGQWKQGKFEHRKGFIEQTKKLKFIDNAVAMALNNKNDSSVADLLADMDLNIVRDLSLCSRQLTHLSEEIGVRLTNLVYLDLSNNKLDTLPHSLQLLARLQSLNLNHNALKTPPLTIAKISNLRILQLAGNCAQSLPDNFGELKHLETLNLSTNRLTDLPDSCDKLNRLKSLDLSGNNFKTLPNCITRGMRSLETLDVSKNLYINVAMAPASKKLKRLYVREAGKNIKFPAWLLKGRAPDLQVLECDGTRFKLFIFPEMCPSLKLRTLSLDNCCVYDKFVNEITSQTDELQLLRVGNKNSMKNGNAFWEIPIKNLKRPKLLVELSIRGTALPKVCKEIGHFINLVKLDLGNNYIYCLPDEICLLSKLEVLLIDEDDLNSLPDNIGAMTNLRELKANKNHLASLPESMRDLKYLTYLDLYDNEFGEVPEQLNHLESLVGVDIDQNNLDVDDLHIRDLRYEAMRSTLRNKYESAGDQRISGRRYESESEELSDSTSDISSIECDESYTTVIAGENGTNVEENWDVSDNSADEFEPGWERKVMSEKRFSFTDVLSQRFAFCPADLHKMPVSQQVALKKQRGEIDDDSQVVEGQFEDA